MQDPTFSDFEWIAIENALEALLTHLDEMAEPEFAVALENVVWEYDLDNDMEREVVNQYDDLCNMQYTDFE